MSFVAEACVHSYLEALLKGFKFTDMTEGKYTIIKSSGSWYVVPFTNPTNTLHRIDLVIFLAKKFGCAVSQIANKNPESVFMYCSPFVKYDLGFIVEECVDSTGVVNLGIKLPKFIYDPILESNFREMLKFRELEE